MHKVYSLNSDAGTNSTIIPNDMVKVWDISIETARGKIQVTTGMFPRNTTDIILNRGYEVNNCMIIYPHLNTYICMDTVF